MECAASAVECVYIGWYGPQLWALCEVARTVTARRGTIHCDGSRLDRPAARFEEPAHPLPTSWSAAMINVMLATPVLGARTQLGRQEMP